MGYDELMFSPLLIIAIALGYVGVLFFIAWWGDRRAQQSGRNFSHPVIYSLSLAVYCTSWTFYGAVGQAARNGWDFLPVYLGPLLMFLLFGGLIVRIVRISKEQNITSISDFLASRFGKTQKLAVLVTVVAVLGVIPYIALQLKAIAMGFDLLTTLPTETVILDQSAPIWRDSALMIALLLALFTILFGTRQLDATEHHPGLMLAIAFESLFKLLAFIAVGVFVTWFMFDGPSSLNPFHVDNELLGQMFAAESLSFSFITILVLSMLAAFCLPRQFHVTVVESTSAREVRIARWLFPLYLILIAVFIVPVAVAGMITFGGAEEADAFMLILPMAADQHGLTLLAMLGGFSAATGMVIVACVALSIMVSNDIVMPALLRLPVASRARGADLGRLLLLIRRLVIVGLLLMAWIYYRLFGYNESLANIGLLSFAAVAQFGPLVVAAMIWRRANRRGALLGLSLGFSLWFYTLLLPGVLQALGTGNEFLVLGPFGIEWLRPETLFGLELQDPLTHGVVVSLGFNMLGLFLGSWSGGERAIDRIQANAFLGATSASGSDAVPRTGFARVGDFINLTRRFLGERRTTQAFRDFARLNGRPLVETEPADAELVRHTERVLSGVIGASSARLVLSSALAGSGMRFDEVVSLLDQTSQKLKFRQELLQSAMENLSEGISVVDSKLRLVAWNRSYLEMFDYPDGLIHIGRPIREVLEFNARRGQMGEGEIEALVAKRLAWLRQRNPHFFERVGADGRVLEIRGNPMPGGGFVTSFTDITDRKRSEEALRESERSLTEAKTDLEQRVIDRTRDLTDLNEALKHEVEVRLRTENALTLAKRDADEANQSKTRFLAAASHDLLQPLNAARLFASALEQNEGQTEQQKHLTQRLSGSLNSAEELLGALLDISRLDAGAMPVQLRDIAINDILDPLHAEFSAIAESRGLDFKQVSSSARILSDPKLLRRVLQNFIANALRYTDNGRVLIGCRRRDDHLRIQVLDTGPGISKDQQKLIFREFHRLDIPRPSKRQSDRQSERGLGLGLAIVERIARVLDHAIELHSEPGRGTVFEIVVPMSAEGTKNLPNQMKTGSPGQTLDGMTLLCVDNEPDILLGMAALIEPWGCHPLTAANQKDAMAMLQAHGGAPDVMLADYHLDQGRNGIDLMNQVRAHFDAEIPGILITADQSETVRLAAKAQGYRILQKPLRPAALRALLSRLKKRSLNN